MTLQIFFREIATNILKDEADIEWLSNFFGSITSYTIVANEQYRSKFRQVLEGVWWIYYLGDPAKWISTVSSLGETGYFPYSTDSPGPYDPYESISEIESAKQQARIEAQLPELKYVSKVVLKIPPRIFTHFIDRFGILEYAFWNIADFAKCERSRTINTITLEMGELKKQV